MESKLLDYLSLDAPWFQLTRLSLLCSEAGINTILEILRQCLNLEDCTMSMYLFYQSPLDIPSRHRPIHLAKLRKLHLCDDEDLFSAITGAVVTPVLEELVLNFQKDTDQNAIKHPDIYIYQFLRANANTVLRRLWTSGLSARRVYKDIIHLKLLEELTLVLDNNEDWMAFRALQVYSDNCDIPLPCLRSLRFITSIDPIAQESFINFVKSRWWCTSNDEELPSKGFSRLRHVSLQDKFEDDNALHFKLPMLDKFRKEGLDVSFLSPCSDDQPNFKQFKG